MSTTTSPQAATPDEVRAAVTRILDLARWAPSGDNTQPWRFEVVDDRRVAVHGHDTRTWCVYDFDGHASQISHGALLETLRIAATGHGLVADWVSRKGCPDEAPIYDLSFSAQPSPSADPLLPFIEKRTVQRRVMKTTPLTPAERSRFEAAAGPGFQVRFFESFGERWQVARLLWKNAYIRLTSPEAYEVHRQTIDWRTRFSKDRIPEEAVGTDPATARLMEWVMKDWSRVAFFNRYLMGTVAPRVQLDLLPALGCAAHLLLLPRARPSRPEDYVEIGAAVQRIWLTASALDLHLQPELTPVIFRWYAQANRSVSRVPGLDERVRTLAAEFEALAGKTPADGFGFFCRVGHAPVPRSRSLRKDLGELMHRSVD